MNDHNRIVDSPIEWNQNEGFGYSHDGHIYTAIGRKLFRIPDQAFKEEFARRRYRWKFNKFAMIMIALMVFGVFKDMSYACAFAVGIIIFALIYKRVMHYFLSAGLDEADGYVPPTRHKIYQAMAEKMHPFAVLFISLILFLNFIFLVPSIEPLYHAYRSGISRMENLEKYLQIPLSENEDYLKRMKQEGWTEADMAVDDRRRQITGHDDLERYKKEAYGALNQLILLVICTLVVMYAALYSLYFTWHVTKIRYLS